MTPKQEAAALVEGASEGMWLDMWILPNYIEAERAGCLETWLLEFAPRGSMGLDYQMIANVLPPTQDVQLCSGSLNGHASFGKTCPCMCLYFQSDWTLCNIHTHKLSIDLICFMRIQAAEDVLSRTFHATCEPLCIDLCLSTIG